MSFSFAVIIVILLIVMGKEISDLKKDNKDLRREIQLLKSKLFGETEVATKPVDIPQQSFAYNSSGITNQQNPVIKQEENNKTQPTLEQQKAVAIQEQKGFTPINSNFTPISSNKTPVKKEFNKQNLESLLGKNILGISAIVLIFIGIIAFGVLVFSQITDIIKVIGMFIGSATLVGIGAYLHKKSPNTFTESLTGCGFGAIFISIWTTHLYFETISSMAALLIVLLWIVGISIVSKVLNYKYLSYISYIATIITSIATLISGQEQMVMISLYQVVTLILILIANKENHTLIKLSTFSSTILNLIFMFCHIEHIQDLYWNLNTITTHNANAMPLFAVMMLMAVLNFMIYVFSIKKAGEQNKYEFNIGINFLNGINIIAVFLGINAFAEYCGLFDAISLNVWDIVQEVMLIATMMAIYFVQKLFIKNKLATNVAIISLEIVATIMTALMCEMEAMNLLFILIPVINAYKVFCSKNDEADKKLFYVVGKISVWISSIIFLSQMIGTTSKAVILLFFIEILLNFCINLFLNKTKNSDNILGNFIEINFMLYGLIGISTIILCNQMLTMSENTTFGLIFATIIILLANILRKKYLLMNTETENNNIIISEIFAMFWIMISTVVAEITSVSLTSSANGYIILLSLVFIPLGLFNIKDIMDKKMGLLSVLNCFKFTVLSAMFISRVFPELFDTNFAISIYLMLIAGICIAVGFMKDVKPIRLYGLITVMLGVGKMVIYDVWDQASMTRVVSLIVGGIICFAISAGYSYIEKKHKNETIEEIPVEIEHENEKTVEIQK